MVPSEEVERAGVACDSDERDPSDNDRDRLVVDSSLKLPTGLLFVLYESIHGGFTPLPCHERRVKTRARWLPLVRLRSALQNRCVADGSRHESAFESL